jgi:hypothetical protein
MLYKMYAACWTPFSIKPVVYLAHHWNRSGAVTVNAFSNCPKVRLLINNVAQGTDQTPSTGGLSGQCSWNVNWASGTLRAEGLNAGGNVVCFDEKKTAGAADHVVLTVDTAIVKPNGDVFDIRANGTDVALIMAAIVDVNGNICPTASNVVTFKVTGAAGNYRGGTDQMVTAGQPLGYHAPLDTNLSAEGGYCMVVVKSTFTPGTANVIATSPGLGQGTASFTTVPVDAPIFVQSAQGPVVASSAPKIKIGMSGISLRYYLNSPASVSMEILGANGRVLKSISNSRQTEGWHPVNLSGNGNAKGNGVYLVRFTINGAFQCVKRILVMQ